MTMKVMQLSRRGNSLHVVIPAEYRRMLGFKYHDYVSVELTEDNRLIIKGVNDAIGLRRTTSTRGAHDLTKART